MTITRTLNPLPFEHMEPKRFEDLVRQLAYDFRPWISLEATGRAGSDQGYDALGMERAPSVSAISEPDDEDFGVDDDADPARMWLIQCKREKSVTPSKLRNMLAEIPVASTVDLYGLIFAAACDFSKATRDVCREWCRDRGIAEVHIWGKGEIEDQLFQPKNDHLLFAFFGLSLQIRRRSAATRVRRSITLKRRIRKLQEAAHWPGAPIIIRDPDDDRYPRITRGDWNEFRLPWRPSWSLGVGVRGLRVLVRLHRAYYDPETEEWDFATRFNQGYPQEAQNLWPRPSSYGSADETVDAWGKMPAKHQAHFGIIATLPYDQIIEIDPEPDGYADITTVFTAFKPRIEGGLEPPFNPRVEVELTTMGGLRVDWDPDHHVRAFPDALRDPKWEKAWSEKNNWRLSTKQVDLPVDPRIEAILRGASGLED